MDGENNGSKPYEQMDDFGGTIIFGSTHLVRKGPILLVFICFFSDFKGTSIQNEEKKINACMLACTVLAVLGDV